MVKNKVETVNVPAHSHCKICGRSVPVKKNFCSVECTKNHNNKSRKQKRTSRFFLIAMIAVLGVLIFSNMLMAPGM